MKHSFNSVLKKELNKTLSLVKKNHLVSFEVGSSFLLPLVLSAFDFKKLLVCDNSLFDDVLGAFGSLPQGVVGFPFVHKFSSDDFVVKSYYQEMFENASVCFSSDPASIKTCVVDERILDVPALSVSPPPALRVGSRECSQEDLCAFLETNNYRPVDCVDSPGEFVVRGGVVDVFSFGLSFPFRCCFLDKRGPVIFFNPSTGVVIKKEPFCLVFPRPGNKKKSIRSFCSDFYSLSYKPGLLSITNPFVQNKNRVVANVSFESVPYEKYRSGLPGPSVFFCDLLVSEGCFFGGFYFFPSWFSPNFSPPPLGSIPLSGFLNQGDYYIHESFGVCKYLGLSPGEEEDEKVLLQFSDGRLSLAVRFLNRLSFFASNTKGGSSLDSLNKTGRWQQKKKASYRRAFDFVDSVVRAYASRGKQRIKPLLFDEGLVSLFLSSFPYVDTPDQALAWRSVCGDLCSARPMHRLLCGDVGFGKTEVALRAVFFVCINKKQSLVLAPTTILSQQLFVCFSERLSPFGITVVQASRLTKKSKENLLGFSSGTIDVVVGTHAIIKSPKALKKASLIVVDEEHRFGVKDKEKIFTVSPGCHYLSMSATPIPRTLQLSLSGVRNVSSILTPPASRLPVITNVYFYTSSLLSSIILREVGRLGSVFVVDNSVNNVLSLFRTIKELFPLFVVSFLFGSMEKNKINKTMSLFRAGKIHVLVSTIIVESGIDVPLANTIVINNAHSFGLSRLHQLRGRVGRSGVQSYAYLLVPKSKKLSLLAQDRLLSIKKHSFLGSGYRLALEDLRLRGAGSLFGYSQSGRTFVGFEYYTKLLGLAMKNINNLNVSLAPADVVLGPAFIPASLVSSGSERAYYYKSISECVSLSSLFALKTRLVSLFGSLPKSFLLLFISRRLSLLCEGSPVVSIVCFRSLFTVLCSSVDVESVSGFLSSVDLFFNQNKLKYTVVPDGEFLKFQFSFVVEDSYILLESFIKKLYV